MPAPRIIAATALSLLLTTSVAAEEEGPTPEQQAAAATETRQAVFKLLAFNIGPIVGMARGAPFDAAVAERNATRIAALAPMIPDLFAAMDTRGFDVETEALPVIWENPDDFAAKATALQEAATTFAATAAGGDQAETLGGLRNLGGACGNCHDSFRVDDEDE